MSIHRNRHLWQKHVLAENRRSIKGLLETLCDKPVVTVMATGEEHRGRDAVTAFYSGLFRALPDATFDLRNVFVDLAGVVEESVLRGTHLGEWYGVPPTGRAIRLPLTIVFPMGNGKILGERLYFDMATLLGSLTGSPTEWRGERAPTFPARQAGLPISFG